MIGLEFILNLYNMEHQSVAEQLGIKKQNIHLWISGKQNISKKHLPILSNIFGIQEEYFQKELDDVDKLIIQKEKLRRDFKPQVVRYDTELKVGKDADLYGRPVYNHPEFNSIHLEIEKAKLVADFREMISAMDDPLQLMQINQINLLLKDHRKDPIFEYTVDAISHYYDILPDWVGDPESDEFVEDFLKLANHHAELIEKYEDVEEDFIDDDIEDEDDLLDVDNFEGEELDFLVEDDYEEEEDFLAENDFEEEEDFLAEDDFEVEEDFLDEDDLEEEELDFLVEEDFEDEGDFLEEDLFEDEEEDFLDEDEFEEEEGYLEDDLIVDEHAEYEVDSKKQKSSIADKERIRRMVEDERYRTNYNQNADGRIRGAYYSGGGDMGKKR